MTTTNLRPKPQRLTPPQKAAQQELKSLYGWPPEMDDDVPHHLRNQPTWVDLVGQR